VVTCKIKKSFINLFSLRRPPVDQDTFAATTIADGQVAVSDSEV